MKEPAVVNLDTERLVDTQYSFSPRARLGCTTTYLFNLYPPEDFAQVHKSPLHLCITKYNILCSVKFYLRNKQYINDRGHKSHALRYRCNVHGGVAHCKPVPQTNVDTVTTVVGHFVNAKSYLKIPQLVDMRSELRHIRNLTPCILRGNWCL